MPLRLTEGAATIARVRLLLLVLSLVLACTTSTPPSPTPTPGAKLARLFVGGAETGGLMVRARLVSAAAPAVQLAARPGRGGVDALAELAARETDATLGAVTGARAFTAELLEGAAPRLQEMIPVARLAAEPIVVAVARASPIADGAALRTRLERGASALRIAGSEIGSVEHIFAAMLVKATENGARALVFAAYGTTDDAARGVAGGQSDLLVARYRDAKPHLESGALRALAVSSATRPPGVEVPTLRETGVDLTFVDWALLVMPPRVTVSEVSRLRDALRVAHASAAWKDALAKDQLVDDFSTEGMTTFVGVELTRAQTLLLELGLIR